LRLQVDNQAPGAVLRGDPTRLAQLLLNLLGNAVKFTDQGVVQLTCSLDWQDAAHPLLSVAVSDTGIGIASQRLQQLFNAFEQADNSTTRRFGGTGLGLAISRHLAELMQGEISVSSQLGGGSEFRFVVRLQAADAAAAPARASSLADAPTDGVAERSLRAQYAGQRVLLAEDNPVNQLVASELLLAVGLQVDVADNGLQAIELAASTRYAAILMDVQMPQLDGLQAARAIRQLATGRQVPILAMTANAFSEDRAACLAAGMNDHIAKPVVPERLYELLLRWFRAPPPITGAALAEPTGSDTPA
jgi:CheY-like chemotaxis protein